MQEITCPLPQPSDPQPVTSYSPTPEANRGGLQVKENLYMRGDSTFFHFLLKMRQTRLRMLRTWGSQRSHGLPFVERLPFTYTL